MANGTLKVSNIETSSGSGTITLGASGETVTIPSGCTLNSAGTLSGFGVTSEYDIWMLTSNFALTSSNTFINSGWSRITDGSNSVSGSGFEKLGTGKSESSGIFSFPSTGKYIVTFNAYINAASGSNLRGMQARLYVTTNNSDYNFYASMVGSAMGGTVSNECYMSACPTHLFDVTDTSTHKVKLYCSIGGNGNLRSNDSNNNVSTTVSFQKVGDT